MKEININTVSLNNLTVLNSGKISGDLAGMVNFVKSYSNDNNYILNSFTSNDYKIVSGVNRHYYDTCYCESDSTNTNNILMIKDSFTSAMFDYIASSFYKSSFIHRDNFKNSDIIYNNPNIVVFQVVERGLMDSLFTIIPGYKIEEINKDLETNFISKNN